MHQLTVHALQISLPSYGLSNSCGGSRPSVLITGRPVVILEDSLLARVLGRGQSDPFIITRQPPAIPERQTEHWATGGNIVSSLPMAKCQPAISSKHFMHSSTSQEMVSLPVPELESPPAPRHDMAVVPYGTNRSSHHTWEHEFYPQINTLVCQVPWTERPSDIPLDHLKVQDTLSMTVLCAPAEDTGIAKVPSSPQEVSESMMFIPESPPIGPSKCSLELQSLPQCSSPISPPEETTTELEKSLAILQDSEGSIQLANECEESNAAVWEDVKQLEPEITGNYTTESSEVCVSPETPQIDQPTRAREEEVTSQYSVGERILRAWTQTIVSLASEEQQEQEASEPDLPIPSQQLKASKSDVMASACHKTQTQGLEIHGEKQSPKKVSTIPPVARQPASSSSANFPSTLLPLRAAFVCEEREEQILQESDSEMEMPEELEGASNLTNSHKESSHDETTVTELPLPPPPPPPPPFQQASTPTSTEPTLEIKATTTATAEAIIDDSSETEASYKLLNPFHSDTQQSTSASSLLDFPIAPLRATQLSQHLQFGLQQAGLGSSISDLHAPLLASSCKWEGISPSPDVGLGPPEKKLKFSEENDSTASDSTKQSNCFTIPAIPSESAATVPELKLETHVPEQMTVSGEGHLRDETLSRLDNPHEGVCVGQKLDHPHDPYECMDDGLDTVYQAVPTECAREHAHMPNPLCRDNEGSGESHDDSEEGGGGGDTVQQVPEEASHNETDPHEDKGAPPNTVEGRLMIELDSAVPSLELEGENLTRDPSDESQVDTVPLQTTLPEESCDYEHTTLFTSDQQIVPESSLNSSLTAQSLYDEGSSSHKIESKLTGSQLMCSLEDVDIDELDGPTVLAMALDSIESRRKTELVGSTECVHQRSPSRQCMGGYASLSTGATLSSHGESKNCSQSRCTCRLACLMRSQCMLYRKRILL